MQSAPNIEKVLAFLNSRGHSYHNEKALLETCRDPKTFMALLKDLLQELEFGFIRSWMATEAYSFSQDVERTRLALPVLNDYLAQTTVLSQLKMQFRLGMLFSKQAGERAIPVLNRIIGFLQERAKVFQQTQGSRVDYQLMFKTYKNINERRIETANQQKQVMAQKEKERPIYEKHKKELSQLKSANSQREVEVRKIIKEIEYFEAEFKAINNRKSEAQRSIEQAELKIAQYKRQLIQFAPDIKKEKEHLEVKINSKREIIAFKQKLWHHISETLLGFNETLHQQKRELDAINEKLAQNYELYHQLTQKGKENEQEMAFKGPELKEKEQEIKRLEMEISCLEANAYNNQLFKEKLEENIVEEQNNLHSQEKVEKMLNDAEDESLSFKAALEARRREELLTASQAVEGQERIYRQKIQSLREWHDYIQKAIKGSRDFFRIQQS